MPLLLVRSCVEGCVPGKGCRGTKLFIGLESSGEWPADAVGSPLLPT